MILWLIHDACAALTVEGELLPGVEARICALADAGEAPPTGLTLHVITRPGLPGQHDAAVSALGKDGCAAWTPEAGGVVQLVVGEDHLVARVAEAPPADLGVALAVILGAAAWLWRQAGRG